MHLIGALMGAALCIAAGGKAAGRLQAREKLLRAWAAGLQYMEGEIERGGEALPLLFRHAGMGKLPALQKAADVLEHFPALSPEKFMQEVPLDVLLTPREKETLENCLLRLFSPSPEMQLKAGQHLKPSRPSPDSLISTPKKLKSHIS